MPTLLVIRLHPSEAVSAVSFTDYLNDLSIDAHELSLVDPGGTGPAFGTATYLPPAALPPSPSPDPAPVPDPNTRITQHFDIDGIPPNLVRTMKAVATAVIEIPDPPAGGEYKTADVRLVITRGGNEIIHKQKYYNVPVAPAPIPGDPNDFPALTDVSLHLSLPSPGQQTGATVTVPEDGSAPNWNNLRAAVEDVLNNEPGDLSGIADLTLSEARHVAYQIIWDRDAFPLPEPNRSMEDMYTGPHSPSDDEERDRQIFEGDLLTYYVKHDNEAERLTNFVFSLSASIWCEQQSAARKQVGYVFPVFPSAPDRRGKVNLKGVGNADLDPGFVVPAEYFYALTGVLPGQVKRQQRFDMAILDSEAQSISAIEQAMDDHVISEPPGINRFQAARRLRALGLVGDTGTPRCEVVPASATHTLITDWLAFGGADIDGFWTALTPAQTQGHLDIVLCAVTHSHQPLINAITDPGFGVNDVDDLAGKTNQDWQDLLYPDAALLPPFTAPGTVEERTQAFIRNLRRFFDVANVVDPPDAPVAAEMPLIERSPGNPVDQLLAQYPGGFSFEAWDAGTLSTTLDNIFPGDPEMKARFTRWLVCIRDVIALTAGIAPETVRFSVIEALWARGILNPADLDGTSLQEFQDALVGTVAYEHAPAIWNNAQPQGPAAPQPAGPFTPVNPDGSLVNCIPPKHLSPLEPVAYLQDLLKVSPSSTCDVPLPEDVQNQLAQLLASRRGPLGDLLASAANLDVPLPLIDIVNESLEHMVADEVAAGAVYNTSEDQVGGHLLDTHPSPPDDVFTHDPATLFEALPEHSTPATPTAGQTAWDKVKADFSACSLPYHQPLDIARSYLDQLGTGRYAAMRGFRRSITEFVLDPAKETPGFQNHLWRYPVRHELALEYLGITPEEYNMLYSPGSLGPATLPRLFGFSPQDTDDERESWTDRIVKLPEFLARTCLTYCEFVDLWRSDYVTFQAGNVEDGRFPDCQACCIEDHVIVFTDPADLTIALKRLAVFVRLWRKLQAGPNTTYTFTELADIATVLKLFKGNTANPDFIRQLTAFQMLRDDFGLSLTDGSPASSSDIGEERTHLLALWVPNAAKWPWAVSHLLEQIQQYALDTYHCKCRPPEFIKILKLNLDPLSRLAGFDPDNPDDTWHARPTHTLRFIEILAKIYASDFQVGELLFLFTADPQLQGGDPYPLQTKNEALDLPFGLPDDEQEQSLFALRDKLLKIPMDPRAAEDWTWSRMGEVLQNEFGMPMPPASDRWSEFGKHFFPAILSGQGILTAPQDAMYRVALAGTSQGMWNTPYDGPFQYDAAAQELGSKIPLSDEAVIDKLSRIRQLNAAERHAVSELYYQPRAELAFFAFIFDNQLEAEARMIQEQDEAKRWHWFQMAFQRFYGRCHAIAAHLADHLDTVTGDPKADGKATAMLLLKHLRADENKALGPWENDNGHVPAATWSPPPNGGAFAALLGVTGTGMVAEYTDASDLLRWREVRGGIEAFGDIENASNAPIPTVIPAMEFTFSAEQLQYAAMRNGFAMANEDGRALGGGEPFRLSWKGLLLIEKRGRYGFRAGAPKPGAEIPDFEKIRRFHRWRVILQQGQKTWVLLSHEWPGEEAPPDCADAIRLERGFYDLHIEFERLPVFFDGPEDICPQTTGFQLKYDGPDAAGAWMAIPNDKLFIRQKDARLMPMSDTDIFQGAVQSYFANYYVSTVRDMRRTYQRVFKAMLFADRLDLSAMPAADDGQPEIGYMLSKPENFRGQSYYRNGANFITHKADLDFNLFPVLDNYHPPGGADDGRAAPTPQRTQALFDWWERLFDYTVMRAAADRVPEIPVWLLFHEAAESHQDKPAHLLRHMGVDILHDSLVLQYYDPSEADLSYDVTSADLEDDRWAVRVWHADLWIQGLNRNFLSKDITEAMIFLWASDGPEMSGLDNLTKFYRDGCIENGDPRRYKEIKALNDGLRERGRAALLAYLTHIDRVPLPWGGFAREAKQISELLLLDVEAGLCQKASRVEEAITAIQLFVNRARLGLEPGFTVDQDFVFAWERHFAAFRIWQACKRRQIYRENWIEWTEAARARGSEAYRFLESELRRSDLTLPIPGGLTYWTQTTLPAHSNLTLLQHREPATITFVDPPPEGLGLMGMPDRHARPSWLAPLRGRSDDRPNDPPDIPITGAAVPAGGDDVPPRPVHPDTEFPMWFQAAVRLGTKFLRIAAAGTPITTAGYTPRCDENEAGPCCATCDDPLCAIVDEYYFWIETSEYYEPKQQVAEWGAVPNDPQNNVIGDPKSDWHRPDQLPALLQWESKPMVHLHWCRVHNGEFQTPRKSSEGVKLAPGANPQLQFTGRAADSLNFAIAGGLVPVGLASPPPAGFRYDLATDSAITLPETVAAPDPDLIGGLAAFPFFAWHCPGDPLLPRDAFSAASAIAMYLANHCRYDESLKWLDLIYKPLEADNAWTDCTHGRDDIPGHTDSPIGATAPPSNTPGNDRPDDPCCCPSDPVPDRRAKERLVMMRYAETLTDWADALMAQNTPEAFQQARLLVDTAGKILGKTPRTILETQGNSSPVPVLQMEPACAPLNPRLMCLYTQIEDRQDLIHACLNARRLPNGRPNVDMPYFGNDVIRACWHLGKDICLEHQFWCKPDSPYRFQVMVQKAIELANEVKSLGGQLLGAYEKGDAEYLSQLRVMHERQLNELALQVRQHQWRDADWQVQALQKAKEIALTNLQYYQNLIAVGLISGEAQYESLVTTSTTLRSAGNIAEAIGQAMNLIPDPNVGFPVNFVTLPPGKKLAMIFAASGKIATTAADIIKTVADLGLTKAGWDRREQEWIHQVDILTIEVEQIERQILGAERRRDAALRELNNHRQMMENAAEVHDFLRDKFTSHALYLWLQQQTAALHYRMYEIALHCAYQAQRAFNYERGFTADSFIPAQIWDDLHEGLLSGERLVLALRQMEKSYYERNAREYELSKHISLRLHFPEAFLQLQTLGYCEIEIPEWMFDLDYPGHYMRRIKNVSVTIPCVVGPYTGVHCRLTLLSSVTRVSPELLEPAHECCSEAQVKNGYVPLDNDTRLVKTYAATDAIATSAGQNDSGMFELNFRDERYLPFEFEGAVSRWRIELPLENNHFNMESLSDFVLHLNFMAREGGENLRAAAAACARAYLPGNGVRFLDAKKELGGYWRRSPGRKGHKDLQRLGLRINRSMFPYLTGQRDVAVNRLEILFEAPDARPSTHHTITFYARQGIEDLDPDKCKEDVYSIEFVGDSSWPGFFHGAITQSLGTIGLSDEIDVGVLEFPPEVEKICNTYLLVGYETVSGPGKCASEPMKEDCTDAVV